MLFNFVATALCALVSNVIGIPVSGDANVVKRDSYYTGEATYFYPGLGACGVYNTTSQPVVALDPTLYSNGTNCLKYLTITNPANGITTQGQVVDECASCVDGHIGLSTSLFTSFGGNLTDGVIAEVYYYFD